MSDKVYVVWYDNGESWGDNFSDIEAIFATCEDAEKYLNKYYVRNETSKVSWQRDKTIGDYTCRCGFKKCDDEDNLCPVYEKWEDDGYLTDYPCEEYKRVMDNWPDPYDYAFWTIREIELGEPAWSRGENVY